MTKPASVERLVALGIELPPPPGPSGLYSRAIRHQDLLFVSGHAAMADGRFVCGTLGADLSIEQGFEAARLATLGCLSSMRVVLGDLERVERVLKVVGFVRATADFTEHPRVVDGSTDLLLKVFGPCEAPARSAVGMTSLPHGTAVEIEMVVGLRR